MGIKYSEKCIKKYLGNRGIRVKIHEEIENGNVKNGYLELFTKDQINLGIIVYIFIKNELFIEEIRVLENINQIIKNLYIKPTAIFLMYLIARYSYRKDITYIKLNSNPTVFDDVRSKGSRQHCLSCYYQKLGFEPNLDELNFFKELINSCLKRLKIKFNNYENDKVMCILCDCQDYVDPNDIKLDGFRFSTFEITMEKLIENLTYHLKEMYDSLKDEC